MGCSVAWHLAQRGITNVVLLEREPQLGAGSTGKNAGGFRHQFSNSANIELSIESVALMKRFEDDRRHADRLSPGRLSVPVVEGGERRDVQEERRASAEARRRRALGVERRSARALTRSRSHRRQGRDLLPVGRRGGSERRHDGIRQGRASQGRRDRSRMRSHGREADRTSPHRGAHVEGRHFHADLRQRRGTVGEIDRPAARRRRARRAGAPPHLHRLAARRRIVGRSPQCRPRAEVEDSRHRLRQHVLFPSRRRRIAVRHGRSR